ncbi:YciI family protein [uncultured Pontibacter sp.]|uniref:YciI family protein n=1 Tax=uncultured Pontibacter sp. TaxID=453356 RepID=UPI0026080F2F|nr:YciI family protein [uncultured Pontibacter sp.]
MKYILALAILCCFSFTANAQVQNPTYNKPLADSLGADDYGMKQYVLAILKTGSNTTTDKEKLNAYFRGHMENIGRLAKEGKLVVAGPLGKNDKAYRGIFILDVQTVEEARKLVETDPAVKAKIFEVELYPWYGSAALPMYLPAHSKIEKQKP